MWLPHAVRPKKNAQSPSLFLTLAGTLRVPSAISLQSDGCGFWKHTAQQLAVRVAEQLLCPPGQSHVQVA
jgi:hypothetical protein